MRIFRPAHIVLLLLIPLRALLLRAIGAERLGLLQWGCSFCLSSMHILLRRLNPSISGLLFSHLPIYPNRFFFLRAYLTSSAGIILLLAGRTVHSAPYGIVFGLLLPLLELISQLHTCRHFPMLGWSLAALCCWGLSDTLITLGHASLFTDLCCLSVGSFLHMVTIWILSPQPHAEPLPFIGR